MPAGEVVAVHVTRRNGEPVDGREEVAVVAGRGVRGDRHFVPAEADPRPAGTGADLMLIEAEAVEAVARDAGIQLAPGEHRRNVTTRGVALNDLVGERFRVGDVVCDGVSLCEPCRHLESLTSDGVIDALLHRGGLRADVVESGTVRVGDGVEPLADPT